jgi:hypothetical protein
MRAHRKKGSAADPSLLPQQPRWSNEVSLKVKGSVTSTVNRQISLAFLAIGLPNRSDRGPTWETAAEWFDSEFRSRLFTSRSTWRCAAEPSAFSLRISGISGIGAFGLGLSGEDAGARVADSALLAEEHIANCEASCRKCRCGLGRT